MQFGIRRCSFGTLFYVRVKKNALLRQSKRARFYTHSHSVASKSE